MTPFVDIAGWTLVHFVWQGTSIALAAAAIMRLLRHAAPSTRYAVACCALGAMLAAPLVTVRQLVASPSPAASPARVLPLEASRNAALPDDVGPHAAAAPAVRHEAAPSPRTGLLVLPAFLPVVVSIWLAGVAVLLVRLLGGGWRVRTLHRASLALGPSRWQTAGERLARRMGLAGPVHIADSSTIDTPTVLGIMRPVILLPVAALASLTPAQVEAILAHELAHIRRHDFLVNLLQSMAETLLFYHPAVWWLSARIRLEREQCCDDVAVEVCGDAIAYAEALTALAASGAASGAARAPLALAATSGSLLDRVRRLVGGGPSQPRRPFAATLMPALMLFLLGVLAALYQLPALQAIGPRGTAAPAQTGPDLAVPPRVHFGIDARWRYVFQHPAGPFTIRQQTVREMIRFAYQLDDARILGGPRWMDDERFDVVLAIDSDPAADEVPAIVRSALATRFRLAAHYEPRDAPAYALVVARSDGILGPQLRRSFVDCLTLPDVGPLGTSPCGLHQPLDGVFPGFTNRVSAEGITLAQLASSLTDDGRVRLDRRIVDRSGLAGTFDLDVEYCRIASPSRSHRRFAAALLEALGCPSLSTALEGQLGLRLVETTAPIDVLVVDSAERPQGRSAAEPPLDRPSGESPLKAVESATSQTAGVQAFDRSQRGTTRQVTRATRRRVADALAMALNDNEGQVREAASRVLEAMERHSDSPEAITSSCRGNCLVGDTLWTYLMTMFAARSLQSADAEVRRSAVERLRAVRLSRRGSALLAQALTDSDADVRRHAAMHLDSVRSPAAVAGWISLLNDADASLRERAAISLGAIGDPDAIDALALALHDPEPWVRRQSAQALGNIVLGTE